MCSPVSPSLSSWTRLFNAAELQSLMDLDPTGHNRLFERVMRAFGRSLADVLHTLPIAYEARDWPTVRAKAHSLKGASLQVGAGKLAELSLRVQQHIDVLSPDLLRRTVAEFLHEANNAHVYLQLLLSQPVAPLFAEQARPEDA